MKKFMKKSYSTVLAALFVLAMIVMATPMQEVQARSEDKTILDGIYMDQIDLSGMTVEEATKTVNAFVNEL